MLVDHSEDAGWELILDSSGFCPCFQTLLAVEVPLVDLDPLQPGLCDRLAPEILSQLSTVLVVQVN